MNIQEAVKKAIANKGMIYRDSARGKCEGVYAAIKPTDTYDTCILVVLEKGAAKRSGRCWAPTANDLIADDWEVLQGINSVVEETKETEQQKNKRYAFEWFMREEDKRYWEMTKKRIKKTAELTILSTTTITIMIIVLFFAS